MPHCPTCDFELMFMQDYPSITITSFQRLPFPEKVEGWHRREGGVSDVTAVARQVYALSQTQQFLADLEARAHQPISPYYLLGMQELEKYEIHDNGLEGAFSYIEEVPHNFMELQDPEKGIIFLAKHYHRMRRIVKLFGQSLEDSASDYLNFSLTENGYVDRKEDDSFTGNRVYVNLNGKQCMPKIDQERTYMSLAWFTVRIAAFEYERRLNT